MIDRGRPSDFTENKSGTGSWRFAIPRMKKKYGDSVGPSGEEPYTEAPPATVPSRGRTREGVVAPAQRRLADQNPQPMVKQLPATSTRARARRVRTGAR